MALGPCGPLDLVREGGRFQDSRMAPGLYLKRIALPEAGEGPVWVISGRSRTPVAKSTGRHFSRSTKGSRSAPWGQ
jgi:hypothetical protein